VRFGEEASVLVQHLRQGSSAGTRCEAHSQYHQIRRNLNRLPEQCIFRTHD
jgi:hypothetical protein